MSLAINSAIKRALYCWVFVLWAPGALAQTDQPPVNPVPQPEPQVAAPEAARPVAEATINLRTSITGNQEQPRVMYIMPWQSPRASELDMEMLQSQQDAVFGHVEREELLRTLEQLEPAPEAP